MSGPQCASVTGRAADRSGFGWRRSQPCTIKGPHAASAWSRSIRPSSGSAVPFEHDPKPAHLLSLGNALRRQGRLEEAFRLLNRAVEIDIESAAAWKALAGLLADLNRHHEAVLSFQHVLKLDPRDADAAYQAGFLLLQSGKRGGRACAPRPIRSIAARSCADRADARAGAANPRPRRRGPRRDAPRACARSRRCRDRATTWVCSCASWAGRKRR